MLNSIQEIRLGNTIAINVHSSSGYIAFSWNDIERKEELVTYTADIQGGLPPGNTTKTITFNMSFEDKVAQSISQFKETIDRLSCL